MKTTRRSFLECSGVTLAAATAARSPSFSQGQAQNPFADLKSMTTNVQKLTPADFESRIERLRASMSGQKIDALYLNGGTSLEYFCGMRWGLSERMFALVIPIRGELAYVCPKFEEGRAREQIHFGKDIRVWEEDESPYEAVKTILQDRKAASGRIAIEPGVREFVADGLRKACSAANFVNGEDLVSGCRMVKSRKELDYIALACEITKKAYAAALLTLREGMSQSDLGRSVSLVHGKLGAPGYAAVAFAVNSAFPHGSMIERTLKSGDAVLVDGGCRVEGFQSDITRTVVFGKPTDRMQKVWDIVKKAQAAALAAARPGAAYEAVDVAARKVIVDAGYGPGFKYFTHRLGHGIGMDGHEHPYMVRGNKLPLSAGMTFTDEPGIYIQGEFGVRIEDCVHVTEDGASFFGNTTDKLETY
jgi:Xaa-Pro dipeptidase